MFSPCPRCSPRRDVSYENPSGAFSVERAKKGKPITPEIHEKAATQVIHKVDRKILVVDDHAMNRRLIELMLKRMGYFCDLAINGVEALEMALNKQYDLILMDLQMPEMDGLIACQRILEHYDDRTVSIIAVSALVDPDITKECFGSGMKAFYAKPIDHSDLKEIIELY